MSDDPGSKWRRIAAAAAGVQVVSKEHKALADMQLLARGNRLSVMPVSNRQWDYILKLE